MSFDDLPDRQQQFIDRYLSTGDRDESYKDVGYSVEGRGWKTNARNLFNKLQREIEERLETRIGRGAILALNVIQEIMEDKAVSPAVRLNAAKDYLSRGGYDRASESKINITNESKLSDEEIEAQIKQLIGEQVYDKAAIH